MVALSATEDTDWITPFYQNPTNLQTLGEVCDFSIQNKGQMLVIQPFTHDPQWIYDFPGYPIWVTSDAGQRL